MGWFHEHLTLVYGILLGIVVLAGVALVSNKFATNTSSTQYTWGSYGGGRFTPGQAFDNSLNAPLDFEERFTIAELYQNLENSPDRTYASFVSGRIPLLDNLNVSTTPREALDAGEDSIQALLASLKPTNQAKNLAQNAKQTSPYYYYYIPESINSSIPPPPKTETIEGEEVAELDEAHSELYNYGNSAGTPIELYGGIWGTSQSFVHRGFVEDRTDPEKVAKLLQLADAISGIADSLKSLDYVPPEVQKNHDALIKAYEAVGEKTRGIAGTSSDEELLVAIEAYNITADELLTAYLALSNIFTVNKISFSSDEPGRMFVYTNQPAQ